MKLKSLLRSLSHRNYRLFFLGQSISLIGTWMQQIAMSWLVFQLTGSSLDLGVVMFCGQIPALFLSPVAGALVDHINRHKLLLYTQALAMLQAFLLAILDMTGVIAVWQIVPLALSLGIINAFDMPARQAFLSEMVTDRRDLGNAIALNSSLMNGARLLGPSVAGVVLAETSPGICFLLNGISFIAVLVALMGMRLPARAVPHARKKLREGVKEGFVYAFGFVPIRFILLGIGITSVAGSSYNVLLPEFAEHVLHGDARTLGALSAAAGVGALAAAIFLASRKSVLGLGKWLWIGLALMGAGLVAFAQVRQLWTAMPMLAVAGFGMMVQMATSNTLLQTITDDEKRGRVMSFYAMSFLGMAPFGSLLTGWLTVRLGIVSALMINGSACLFSAALFFALLPRLRELIRPIYVRLKILPEAIETASALKMMAKE